MHRVLTMIIFITGAGYDLSEEDDFDNMDLAMTNFFTGT